MTCKLFCSIIKYFDSPLIIKWPKKFTDYKISPGNCFLQIYEVKASRSAPQKSGGREDGWIGGWLGVKAVLRIAYSNQKHKTINLPFCVISAPIKLPQHKTYQKSYHLNDSIIFCVMLCCVISFCWSKNWYCRCMVVNGNKYNYISKFLLKNPLSFEKITMD